MTATLTPQDVADGTPTPETPSVGDTAHLDAIPREGGRRHSVLVIGGGPAGAATGYWLAKAGVDVPSWKRRTFPAKRPAVTA